MQEIYRVTKSGGVLGLATWGTPFYDFWEKPWAKACQSIHGTYEPTKLMSPEWTYAQQVGKNVDAAGFKDVQAVKKEGTWVFENKDEALEYFFKGGNPGCEIMLKAWKEKGHVVEEIKGVYEKALVEAYGNGKGGLKGTHQATFVVARK